MIIQTPASPQNECSQTAIKRRARNIKKKRKESNQSTEYHSDKPWVLIDVILFSSSKSISAHVEFVYVPSEQAQISGKFGIFVCKHWLPLPQFNEHSEYKIYFNLFSSLSLLHTSMNIWTDY
jgi:hypothetical protein